MSDHDQAFEALRAADPTVPNAETDAVRAKVAPPSPTVLPGAPRRGLRQAAVAAAVALAVGSASGYQVAAAQLGSESTEVAVSTGDSVLVPGQGAGPASRTVAGAATDKMMYYGGRAWLTPAGDLSDEAGQEVGYLMDRSGVDMAAKAAALADAFGLEGDPVAQEGGSFVIGDTSGMKASANTGGDLDASASWWFNDPAASPWSCSVPIVMEDKALGGAATSDGTVPDVAVSPVPDPVPAPTCTPISGSAVSKSRAVSIAKSVFATLGLSAEDATWTASSTSWFGKDSSGADIPFRHVTAAVLVGGQPSGLEWSMDIGPGGAISSAGGFFAGFTKTAAYETVGAATAVLRSQNALWSMMGPYEQGGGVGIAYSSVRGTTPAPTPSAAVDADGRPLVSVMLDKVTITSAKPGWSMYYLADGRTALLPAWYLSGDDRTWVQIAVADKYLSPGN